MAGDWWLKIVTTILAALLTLTASAQAPVGAALPPWTRGTLDIHQIGTGTGNAALIVFPDATTLLVDAGPSPRASRSRHAAQSRPRSHRRARRDRRRQLSGVRAG